MKWQKFLAGASSSSDHGLCGDVYQPDTPGTISRNGNNLYPVEVSFDSQQQAMRWDSIHPYLLVNGQLYDMHQTPMVTNRWEGFVPATPMENTVTYRYKFDYMANDFGKPRPTSAYSPAYHLTIQ